MKPVIYRIKLDMEDTGAKQTGIKLKQGDSGMCFEFSVFYEGQQYFDAEKIPKAVIQASNGVSYIGECAMDESGIYVYTFKGTELSCAGKMVMDLKFELDGGRESTYSIIFECIKDTIGKTIEISSMNIDDALKLRDQLAQGIAKAQDAIKEINSIVQQGVDEIIGEAKYYCELTMQYEQNAKTYANNAEDSLDQVYKKLELATFDLDENGNLIYTDNSSYRFTVDDNGYLNYNVYLEALTMSTLLVNNVDASDSHVCTIE